MPHPQLASRQLYRVSCLPDVLETLGFANNVSGYVNLENKLRAVNKLSATVSSKSIQLMLYQKQFLKHESCRIVRSNLMEAARLAKNETIEEAHIIDEYEWYILRLDSIISQILHLTSKTKIELIGTLADSADVSSEFIGQMLKYKRCRRIEAEAVAAALVAMAPDRLVMGKAKDGKVGVRIEREVLQGKDIAPIAAMFW